MLPIVSALFNLVAVAALPVISPVRVPTKFALIVLGSFKETSSDPFTDTPVLVFVLSVIDIVRAVPQVAVVIALVPLKEVPLMFLSVCNLDALVALPTRSPEKDLAVTVAGKVALAFVSYE